MERSPSMQVFVKCSRRPASSWTPARSPRESGKHYITLFLFADVGTEVNPKVMEPDKHEEWNWYDLEFIPRPQFPPFEKVLRQFLVGE
jgi:hypothetical protein